MCEQVLEEYLLGLKVVAHYQPVRAQVDDQPLPPEVHRGETIVHLRKSLVAVGRDRLVLAKNLRGKRGIVIRPIPHLRKMCGAASERRPPI